MVQKIILGEKSNNLFPATYQVLLQTGISVQVTTSCFVALTKRFMKQSFNDCIDSAKSKQCFKASFLPPFCAVTAAVTPTVFKNEVTAGVFSERPLKLKVVSPFLV